MPSPVAAAQVGRTLVARSQLEDATSWANVLATVPLFAELNRRHLRKVAATAKIVRFADRSRIARAGEPGETFYVLLDGEAIVSARGVGQVHLPSGSAFGEMALLDGGPRSANVTAKGDVVCLAISRARFTKLLRAEPSIAIALLVELSRRLRAAQAAA